MNKVLNKLDKKITKLDKNTDLDKIMKIYNEGKHIVDDCDKKILDIENVIDNEVSSDEEEIDIKEIIERMEQINEEMDKEDIDLEKSLEMYKENMKLEKKYNKYKIENKFN